MGSKRNSLLKRDDALRQTEEWNLHIFQAKAVKVCDVPQEKMRNKDCSFVVFAVFYVYTN